MKIDVSCLRFVNFPDQFHRYFDLWLVEVEKFLQVYWGQVTLALFINRIEQFFDALFSEVLVEIEYYQKEIREDQEMLLVQSHVMSYLFYVTGSKIWVVFV